VRNIYSPRHGKPGVAESDAEEVVKEEEVGDFLLCFAFVRGAVQSRPRQQPHAGIKGSAS